MRASGVPFEKLVGLGYDLPVVSLEVRYRQPLTLGTAAVVRTRLAPMQGLRLVWMYEVVAAAASNDVEADLEKSSPEARSQVYLTAQVTLVTVGGRDRKVIRHLPEPVTEVITQIYSYFD